MNPPLIDFNLLPDEIVLGILIKTKDLDTLGRWCQTSKRVARICSDKQLWKTKVLNEYGEGIVLKSGETWKDKYRTLRSIEATISPISSGEDHYGVVDENGFLYMGGNNSDGQLGIGEDSNDRKKFNPIERLKILPKVRQVSCGNGITGVITYKGEVYLWGWNNTGLLIDIPSQQGKYTRPPLASPTKLTLPKKAIKISCGGGYAVLLENNSIYYSMINAVAMKGGGTLDSVTSRGIVEINAIDISAGNHVTAAIDANYNLYLWGKILGGNQHLEAIGMIYDDKTKVTTVNPVKIELPEPVRQVSIGESYLSVLSIYDNIFILNKQHLLFLIEEGKAGLRKIMEAWAMPIVRLPSPVSHISTNEYFAAAVTVDDKLYILGNSLMIEEAVPGYQMFLTPVQIDLGLPVNVVSLGRTFNLAITKDKVANLWQNMTEKWDNEWPTDFRKELDLALVSAMKSTSRQPKKWAETRNLWRF